MSEILNIKLPILSRDSDYLSNIKYSSIVNAFIHAAWQHAKELGLGYNFLSENGMAWVLSKFRIEFYNLPKWPGNIEVETWPKGINRLFYMRDAFFYSDGGKFAALSSDWLIINKEYKRPKLFNRGSEALSVNTSKHALSAAIPILKFKGKADYTEAFKIRYNDLDVNNHLTTVRYIEFIFDTYQKDFFESRELKYLTVNFIKEVPFGCEILVSRIENSDNHQFEITMDDNVFFRAEIGF